MEFEQRKKSMLEEMNSPEPDKSPKGTLDVPIVPLLNTLNYHPSYFTTSSCSGRISILSQPTTVATKKKAKGGTWVFISHDPVDPNTVLDLLFPATRTTSESIQQQGLVFRFEPLIIAIECKDILAAQSLVSLAISCGFRESGITSASKRVIIAIRCSIRLEVPLGNTHKIMVSPEYIRFLVETANEKMEANKRRTDSFREVLLKKGFSRPGISVENGGRMPANCGLHENDCSMCSETENNVSLSSSSCDGVIREGSSESKDFDDTNSGSLEVCDVNLSVVQMDIVGETAERLFLWGHSACTLDIKNNRKIVIFGGFGGMGRHSRRNDSLMVDPSCGKLEAIDAKGPPCPRLGHTASIVGDLVFVIGGRADPMNILNDVWILNTTMNEWSFLQCTGSEFQPRHRHAAAAVGSKIYVFGGIQNYVLFSSLYVLDTHNMRWSEVCMQGEWPCARHSHSMVTYGSQLLMFGGYDGEKALGDLYSFDVQTCLWKKENLAGRAPYARFSHSMFIYNNYLGLVGGCPVRHHYQELSLLDLQSKLWRHIMMNSVSKDLFVRSTASVVGDDLVMIGGGASCYAFGTKFSEPMKINLLPLMSSSLNSMPTEFGEKYVPYQDDKMTNNESNHSPFAYDRVEQMSNRGCDDLNLKVEGQGTNVGQQAVAFHWALQVERKYAKLGKDILKQFGWLDLGRKVHSQEGGSHICFPVTENFCSLYNDRRHNLEDSFEGLENSQALNSTNNLGGIFLKDISSTTALSLLMACNAAILADDVAKEKKNPKSPIKVLNEALTPFLYSRGLPAQLLEQLPTRWERLGDITVLPSMSFTDPAWDSVGKDLWFIVAQSFGARRLARQGRVAPNGTRDSTLEILVGDDGWVDHRENGILYSFDATKCMFSWGNLSEKIRMGSLNCRDEVVVDLYAGIGYFVLPFLVRAKAKLVYACEWNPSAVEALRYNLNANCVADRCIVLEGDNRVTAPKGVADRVCLGLLPSSDGSWVVAVRALRNQGGTMHIHGNVKDLEEVQWTDYVSNSISEIAKSEGYCWEVSVEHVERVKWYAPHIRHIVVDLKCKKRSDIKLSR